MTKSISTDRLNLDISDHFFVVLVGVSHPGNIGSAARAMKTMGLSELILVSPENPPDDKSYAMSAGADDVLANLRIVDSLPEALRSAQLVIGGTARPRDMYIQELAPREGIAQAIDYSLAGGKIALVFGRERSGLTNDEIKQCDYLVRIPSNPDYSSLNLAQAVQVFCYELRMQWLDWVESGSEGASPEKPNKLSKRAKHSSHLPATKGVLQDMLAHWSHAFSETGFLQRTNHDRMMSYMEVMFQRAQLTHQEVNIIRGMLRSISGPYSAHSIDQSIDQKAASSQAIDPEARDEG